MKILVYSSKELQAKLGSKTEPKDYLHVVITNDGHFAIYIWDTREVVETGTTTLDKAEFNEFKNARDNHKPLVNLAEGFEVNFNELPKVPNFKVFRSDKQIACYRHGRVVIIENGKIKEVRENVGTMQEFIANNAEFKKAKRDNDAIIPILDAVKSLKAGTNPVDKFNDWYFIPKAKEEAPAEA